jgi:hypothetical protein
MSLSDDQLRAIGRLTVAFGQLELSASLLLTVLVNPDNQNIGRVAFADAPFKRVLDTIQRLSPYTLGWKPELQRRVKDWIDKARDVAWRRNEVLHAFWVHDQPSGQMVALTHRATRAASTRAADLDQLAMDVALAVRQVDRVLLELLPHAN